MATQDEQMLEFLRQRRGGALVPQKDPSIEFAEFTNNREMMPIDRVNFRQRNAQKGFNKFGQPEYEPFNPAKIMAEKGAESTAEAVNGLSMVKELFSRANELIPPAKGNKDAWVQGVKTNVQKSPVGLLTEDFLGDPQSAREWDQIKSGFGTMLARAFGEKGVVTNRDVARILKMMPREDDTVQMRKNKQEFIETFIGKRVDQYNRILSYIDQRG
jgi:hypothetical protein